ncbi:hypothetical protein ACA910_018526 [Epithemia clementina (nom. ined.)]
MCTQKILFPSSTTAALDLRRWGGAFVEASSIKGTYTIEQRLLKQQSHGRYRVLSRSIWAILVTLCAHYCRTSLVVDGQQIEHPAQKRQHQHEHVLASYLSYHRAVARAKMSSSASGAASQHEQNHQELENQQKQQPRQLQTQPTTQPSSTPYSWCIANMNAADQDENGLLSRAEFGDFVTLQSLNQINNPMNMLPFVTIFSTEACSQCNILTPEESQSCCVGSNEHIVIGTPPMDGITWDIYWTTMNYVCGSVNNAIRQRVGPIVTSEPSPNNPPPYIQPFEPPTVPAPTIPAPTIPAPTIPAPTIPAPAVPTPTVTAPTVTAPTIPAPTIPAPTIPTPTTPTPTIPTPTVPAPSVPAPTIPAPTIPAPTIPAPTISTPTTVPTPTVPTPTIPGPTVPTPTIPAPTVPAPTVPTPTVPTPTIPAPTVPTPTTPAPTIPAPTTVTAPTTTEPTLTETTTTGPSLSTNLPTTPQPSIENSTTFSPTMITIVPSTLMPLTTSPPSAPASATNSPSTEDSPSSQTQPPSTSIPSASPTPDFTVLPTRTISPSPIISSNRPTFTNRPTTAFPQKNQTFSLSPSRAVTTTPTYTSQPNQSPVSSFRPTTRPSFSATPTRTATWQQVGGPFVSDGNEDYNDGFGRAVALFGAYLAIGEPDGGGSPFGGELLVQERAGNANWEQTNANFEIPDLVQSFGSALDTAMVSENGMIAKLSILVGAVGTLNSTTGFRFGSVHYFQYDNNTQNWNAVGSVDGVQPHGEVDESGGSFGSSVTMASSIYRMAVGAPGSYDNATGRVYIYDYDGTDWQPMPGMPIVGVEPGARLGTSLAMSSNGQRLLIGEPGMNDGDGAVYYWEWNGNEWEALLEIRATPGSKEAFGTTVALLTDNGGRIAIGAPLYDDSTGGNRGIVRVYEELALLPMFFQRLGTDEDFIRTSDGAANGDQIGNTLSGAKGRVCFGTENGSVRVYEYNGSAWVQVGNGLNALGSPVVSVSMSEDANSVAMGLANEEVVVYDFVAAQEDPFRRF